MWISHDDLPIQAGSEQYGHGRSAIYGHLLTWRACVLNSIHIYDIPRPCQDGCWRTKHMLRGGAINHPNCIQLHGAVGCHTTQTAWCINHPNCMLLVQVSWLSHCLPPLLWLRMVGLEHHRLQPAPSGQWCDDGGSLSLDRLSQRRAVYFASEENKSQWMFQTWRLSGISPVRGCIGMSCLFWLTLTQKFRSLPCDRCKYDGCGRLHAPGTSLQSLVKEREREPHTE